MAVILSYEEDRKKKIGEFAKKCPHKGKECNGDYRDGLYHLQSHCDQCYDEQKYNIKNGRDFENEINQYKQQQKEADKYKKELTINCKYAENSRYCKMKDFLEICQHCTKKFSR